MQCTIQVVITTENGQIDTREIAVLEREDLTPTTLGLTLADGKAILKALQAVVVEQQMTAYLKTQRPCAHCGHLQRSKGYHTTQVRTLFVTIPARASVSTSASVNPIHPTRRGRSVPWRSYCQNRSHPSCCFWRRSGPPWCPMGSPPSFCIRSCRSMTRWPPAHSGACLHRRGTLRAAAGGGAVVVHRQLSRGVEPLMDPQWPAHGGYRWGLRPRPTEARVVRGHCRQESAGLHAG
jgi:hypothetical protein